LDIVYFKFEGVAMAKQAILEGIRFGGPADYRIIVKGSIPKSVSECLQGLKISTEEQDDGTLLTHLVGSLVDQAALSGVLNTLYETHLTILSVEALVLAGHIGNSLFRRPMSG
jgi:hypothetical protein